MAASWSKPTGGYSLATADQPSTPPSGHRGAGLLDVDQERLELRRLCIGVADGGCQRVGAIALARLTGEPPMDRHADDMHGFAVHHHRTDALGHICFADDHPTLGRGRTQPPCSIPFSFARTSPISMNSSGCRIELISACLVQKWNC